MQTGDLHNLRAGDEPGQALGELRNVGEESEIAFGFDLDGDGTLSEDEVTVSGKAALVRIQALEVFDSAVPNNSATDAGQSTPNPKLFIEKGQPRDRRTAASFEVITESIQPLQQQKIVYAAEPLNQGARSRNLNGRTPQSLKPLNLLTNPNSSGSYRIHVGFDDNGNGKLEVDTESSRHVDVQIVPPLRVRIATFIPQEWIADPAETLPGGQYVAPYISPAINGGSGLIFGGDNRGYSANAGTYRTLQLASLHLERTYGPAVNGVARHAGLTITYDYASSINAQVKLRAAAKSDTLFGDNVLKHKRARADASSLEVISAEQIGSGTLRRVSATFVAAEGNPIPLFGPSIDYRFPLSIDHDGRYRLPGIHDGFPAYEVYINGRRIYGHNPVQANQTPFSLFGAGEFGVDTTGWLW